MSGNVATLTDATFDEEVGASDDVVVVDFWAEWCNPCKLIAPILDEIAVEEDGVTVAKVNIDDSPELALRHHVMSVPTIIFFKDGQEQSRLTAAKPKRDIIAEITNLR